MIKNTRISKLALKQLSKAPSQVQFKFHAWVMMVSEKGIESVRHISGFHDEPLKGKWKGTRSIRLNNQWRAFYIISDDGEIQFIEVKGINPHVYQA